MGLILLFAFFSGCSTQSNVGLPTTTFVTPTENPEKMYCPDLGIPNNVTPVPEQWDYQCYDEWNNYMITGEDLAKIDWAGWTYPSFDGKYHNICCHMGYFEGENTNHFYCEPDFYLKKKFVDSKGNIVEDAMYSMKWEFIPNFSGYNLTMRFESPDRICEVQYH